EHADPAHWLLRARRERPRRRAGKRSNEFSPSDVDCHATLPWGSCPCNEGGYHVLIARSAGASPGERKHIRTVRVLSAPLNVDIPPDQISPSNLAYLHRILAYVEIFRF